MAEEEQKEEEPKSEQNFSQCKYCKNNFNFKLNKIFCSKLCKVKYYYKEERNKKYFKICKNCKKEFKGKIDSIFCSHKCSFDYNKTISQSLHITKLVALKRAKGLCEKCGEKYNKSHVHHIIEAEYYKNGHSPKNGKQNNPDNLIVLCISCHRKLHSKGERRFTNIGKCIACGKEFKFYPKANRGKYCSRKCAYENSNLKLIPKNNICICCGLNYMSFNTSKFCSGKCRNKCHYDNKRRKK